MLRRVGALILVVSGLLLVGETLGDQLFSRTSTYEALTEDFRSVYAGDTIATLQADLETLETVPGAVNNQLLPTLAQQANVPTEQLTQLLANNYPRIVNGLTAIGQVVPEMRQTLTAIEASEDDFAAADAIPTKSLSTTGIPWAIVAAGILAFVAGLGMLGRGRWPAIVAVLLGLALIAVPLVISMPSKAESADRLNAQNASLLTEENAQALRGAFTTFQAMADDFQNRLIPELSATLQIPAAQLLANPVIAALASDLPAGLQRMGTLVSVLETNVPRYQDISPVSFRRVTWIVIGSGVAVLLAGFMGLVGAETTAAAREHRIRRLLGRREKEEAA